MKRFLLAAALASSALAPVAGCTKDIDIGENSQPTTCQIDSECPQGESCQNGICESFNGRMRDELLNETLFLGLDHARANIVRWVADYNERRPHSSLRYLTPAAYAASLTATGARRSNPDQLRRSPVAPPAPLRQSQPGTLACAG